MDLKLKAKWFEKIGYKPHAQQWSYHASQARFRCACCGRRFGKSTMAARDLEPKLFLHDKRYWVVGPTYDLGEKEFRVIWNDLIVGQALGKDKRIKKAYNKKQGDMYIEFTPWRTRLEVRSADHPSNLVGEALDWVIMSEAAKQKEETWQRYIFPALSDKRGGADFVTTPEGYNWLHKIWQTGRDPEEPLYESWTFPSWANTAVYPGGRTDPEILLMERNTTPEWFTQEIGADFSAFVGKIYSEFREDIHVKEIKYDPTLPNYIAFDWGFTNPMAAVEFQVTPMDEIRVWRIHYKKGLTVPAYLRELKAREQPEGYKITMCFGDAADPAAAIEVSQSLAPCAAEPEAKENWRQGVDLVKEFMKVHEDVEIDEDGNVHVVPWTRFYVDHSCTDFVREINNYKSKAPVKGNNVPEMGQKQDDHCMDAIRYGLMHLYRVGVAHHLDEVYSQADFVQDTPGGLYVPGHASSNSANVFNPGSAGAGGFFTFSNSGPGRF